MELFREDFLLGGDGGLPPVGDVTLEGGLPGGGDDILDVVDRDLLLASILEVAGCWPIPRLDDARDGADLL